jgi:hypothetical protein
VPELSRCFGIVIRMYAELGSPHHRPHFHAQYVGEMAIYAIDPIEPLAGSLPRRLVPTSIRRRYTTGPATQRLSPSGRVRGGHSEPPKPASPDRGNGRWSTPVADPRTHLVEAKQESIDEARWNAELHRAMAAA